MNPALEHNTTGLWSDLPPFTQVMAQAQAELAIAHPQAPNWLRGCVQARLAKGSATAPIQSPANDAQESVELAALALGFEPGDAALIALAWSRQQARKDTHPDPLAWPSEWTDFSPSPAVAAAAHAPCPSRLGLYVVAPTSEWIARLVDMGVPTLQLRFKSNDPITIEREVKNAIAAVRGSTSHLFINDFWQLAIDHGAYGIHLGQEDLADADFEVIRQSGLRLGLSTHGYSEMQRAASLHPSYIALGAVYATNLKVMPTQPQGPKRLARYAALLRPHFPLVAIGGIDRSRLDAVLPSGVGSVAAVRAILEASDPRAEVQHWMQRCPASEA